MDDKAVTELVKLTKGVLLAQQQTLEKPDEREKPEVVLARAGFVAREIAELLNKSQHAVTKTIQRAGKDA